MQLDIAFRYYPYRHFKAKPRLWFIYGWAESYDGRFGYTAGVRILGVSIGIWI